MLVFYNQFSFRCSKNDFKSKSAKRLIVLITKFRHKKNASETGSVFSNLKK
jgi:hypothetical protein